MIATAVQAWLRTTQHKYLALQAHAAEPLHTDRRDALLLEGSALLQETVEKVRVLSAALPEGSHAAGESCAALLAQLTQLLAYCTTLLEQRAPLVPAPEDG